MSHKMERNWGNPHHKEKPIKIVQSYNLLKDQIKLEGRIIFKIKFSFHQVVHREFIS